MKVLFWNTNGKKVDSLLLSTAIQMAVDIIVLAEYEENENDFLEAVNQSEEVFVELPQIACKRITIFYREDIATIEHGPESNYYTTKKLTLDNGFQILMVAVHLPSKTNQSDITQTLEAAEFKKEIVGAEKVFDTENTFVVGDFNMNPFEHGMISASAFHSIPCEKIAGTGSRIIKDRPHRFFYNPMWNMFGDMDDNPGTYFYRDSEQPVYFWNILDQVIIRPSISKYFIKNSLKILKNINGDSLVSTKSGRPNLSDHLPIIFEFDFKKDI
ncbi:hypothetical protein DSLASN_01580 [Desulfoluna limicola]|uniref:Endonuclease/exonuclease/phosphatase domain-containing protein n=1 Tax=Desulfoluna limicola TaxID=2810562 RepID=A0ABN6EY56_9BACT|nr:hypothetical protein [Desulfoluna limicola]BCS94526.1 hypothetical protein DSLASN_01580 [Desulfoluna limicola]